MNIKLNDEFALQLEKVAANTDHIAEAVLKEGVKPVADQTRAEINALLVVTPERQMALIKAGHIMDGVTEQEKADLLRSFGVTPAANDSGIINIKTGFDGYGSKPTKKYPNGVPSVLLARSVAKGTRFRQKNDFIKRAYRKARPAAIKAMQDTSAKEIKKILKG